MAIHFRSQIVNQEIKGTVFDASELGWCCDGVSTTQKTRANCQGYPFILSATNANQCAATNAACPSNFTGLIPGACCYWKNVNGDYTQQCTLVINNEQCDALHEGFSEGLQYSFYPGQFCQNDGGSVVCNGIKRVYGDDTLCNPDDSTNCFDPNNILGNCCHSETAGTICSITTKPECGNGVWSPPKNGVVMSCVDKAPCDGVYFSKSYNVPTTDIDEIKGATSVIEKLPQIGDYYQGGIFVGIFNPGTPINSDGGSEIFGNASTGNASKYRARGNDVGNKRAGWVLIADLEDHIADAGYTGTNLFDNISFMGAPSTALDTFASSVYDGLYNTVNNTSSLYSSIKQYTSNGFNDWYLPSQDELALYCNNIKPDTQLYNNYKISEGTYLTSTLFSLGDQREFDSTYFNYTQQITPLNYGQVNLLPVTEKAKIKLFRRIYLGPEIIISNTRDIIDCDACLKKAADERNDAMNVARKQWENLQKWLKGIKPDCVRGPYDPEDKCFISCKEEDGGGVLPGYPKTPYCCSDGFLKKFGIGIWQESGIPDIISGLINLYNSTTPGTDEWYDLADSIYEGWQLLIGASSAVLNLWNINNIEAIASINFGYPTRSYNTTAYLPDFLGGGEIAPKIPATIKDLQAVQSFDQYAFYKMALQDPEWQPLLQKNGFTKVFRETNGTAIDVMITPKGREFIRGLASDPEPILRGLNGVSVNSTEYNNALKLIQENRLDGFAGAYPGNPGGIDMRKVDAFYSKYSGPAVRFGPAEVDPKLGIRFQPIAESFSDIVKIGFAEGRGATTLEGIRESEAILYAALRGGALVRPAAQAAGSILGAPVVLSLSNYIQDFFNCSAEAEQYRLQEQIRLYGSVACRDTNGQCRDPDKLPGIPKPPIPDPWTECRCVPAAGDPNAKCPEPEKWRKCVGEIGIIQLKYIEAVKRCCANPECKPPKVKSPPKICQNIQYLDDPRKKNIPPTGINPDGTPNSKEPYDYPPPLRVPVPPSSVPIFGYQ